MKKRIFALLTALLVLLPLAACESAPAQVDLTAFYDTEIAGKYELPALALAEPEVEDAFYPGISQLDLAQKVLYTPLMNVTATEILMAEAKTDEDADKLEEIFTARLASLESTWSQYLPDQYALVQTAKVTRTGRYVTLIVCEYQSEIESALADALK